MSLIKSIFTFILTLIIAGFCILNAQSIDVSWSPVHDDITLPLYAIIISSLTVGFFLGAGALWINSAHLRKEKRQQKKQIKTLEKEVSQNKTNTNNQNPPTDFFPALPTKSES